MNLHVFQHIDIEGPGVLDNWARESGFTIVTTHLYRGDPLPDPSAVDFLVLMGGPMNIYQDRDYPWLREERAWIKKHVEAGQSAIGICLGAQFLADALGGRVIQNLEFEIGWFPVDFTPEARQHFPFLPPSQTMLHWHGDTFELPAGALPLGSSAACANQGFLYDDRIIALQFHPEMTRDGIRQLVDATGMSLPTGLHVQSGETILAQSEAAFDSAHVLLGRLLKTLKY